jgi:hypothetical protein
MLPLPNMRRDLEVSVEEKITEYAAKRGWWEGKFVCPGQTGVPDRIFGRPDKRLMFDMMPPNTFHARVVLIEVKRDGKKPTAKQLAKHREMRKYGFEVHWVDNFEDAKVILK